MAEKARTIPVRSLVTTVLELGGVAALTVSGWLLVGAAGALAVLGCSALGLSFALTRRA